MIGDRWLGRCGHNWALLRAATNEVGAEVEGWPYAALRRRAEEQPPIARVVDGCPAAFQVDCIGTAPDGELHISIDARGGPPTLPGVKSSYVFYKRPDGTVHYGGGAGAPAA